MTTAWGRLWRWQKGRQGSGYDKLLLGGLLWPIPCDCYLLRFPSGTSVPPHTDRVAHGRHYRLNIILRAATRGGEFVCARPIHVSRRIKLFRPDLEEHSVTTIEAGTRWVLSIGWVRGARGATRPAA
ncbi:2OG-Fe(II) oxygenase [Dyella sp. ASV21]|uniref:2OG-Fe(II) oxygenase n=1 Tax=Dyella sp. ASV21 TaxID=2795114 RepID=UPI0018ED54FC|nr:2OG-Fe(II) oxygenase [Dyella sp. ASV21]